MDVLNDFRMEGVIFERARFKAPWAYRLAPNKETALYALRSGGAWFDSFHADDPPRWCPEGTIVAITRGDAHGWRDSEATPYGAPIEHLPTIPFSVPSKAPVQAGETIIMVGRAPLTASRTFLRGPRFVVLDANIGDVSTRLLRILDFIEDELTYRGEDIDANSIVRRLSEIIVIEQTRHSLKTSPHHYGNLLVASEDRYVRPALQLIHERPELEWTVEELASRAGLGRSAFAARFRKLMGLSPIQYLTMIRMRKAASQMHRSNVVLAEIAINVGYRSEAAFNRAFSRQYGITPGRYYRLYCRPS